MACWDFWKEITGKFARFYLKWIEKEQNTVTLCKKGNLEYRLKNVVLT